MISFFGKQGGLGPHVTHSHNFNFVRIKEARKVARCHGVDTRCYQLLILECEPALPIRQHERLGKQIKHTYLDDITYVPRRFLRIFFGDVRADEQHGDHRLTQQITCGRVVRDNP